MGDDKKKYYIEPALKEDLDKMKELVLSGKDEDVVIIIDGRERSGKSVLAQQIAAYLDDSFELDSVCKTTDEAVDFITNNKKRAVVLDEGIISLHGQRRQEKDTIFIDELLALSGQQNLFTIILAPFIFDLTKRTAVGRSELLIHVKRNDYVRGFYDVYDYAAKRKLYILGKKTMEYKIKGVYPSYRGRFSNIYAVDEKLYREKKLAGFVEFVKKHKVEKISWDEAMRLVEMADYARIDYLRRMGWLKHGAITGLADSLKVQQQTLDERLKRVREKISESSLPPIFKRFIPFLDGGYKNQLSRRRSYSRGSIPNRDTLKREAER